MKQTKDTELFVVTMEECAELIQELSKNIRFGWSYTNKDRLTQEVGDVVCMINLLQKQGFINSIDVAKAAQRKIQKLKKWSNLDLKPNE